MNDLVMPEFLAGRVLMAAPNLDETGDYEADGRFEVADWRDAHVATSLVQTPPVTYADDGLIFGPVHKVRHMPLLDIDVPHVVTPIGSLIHMAFDVTAASHGRPIGEWLQDAEIAAHIMRLLDLGEPSVSTNYPTGKRTFGWIIPEGAVIVPSSTEGHAHLYLSNRLVDPAYMVLLVALARVGVLEPGYVRAAVGRGMSAGRLPWVRKGDLLLHSEVIKPSDPVTLEELDRWIGNQHEPAPFVKRTSAPTIDTTERTTP